MKGIVGRIKLDMFRSMFMLIIALLASTVFAQSRLDTMSFTRMYADERGVSHFADDEIPFGEENTYGAKVTPFTSATSIGYLLLPPGFSQDWSLTPVAQWIIILSGTGELQVLDGEVREFSAGSILRAEDTEGRGHRTRNTGDEAVIIAWIPIGSG